MIQTTTIQPGLQRQVFQHYEAGQAHGAARREQATEQGNPESSIDRVTIGQQSETAMIYDSTMMLHGSANDGYNLLRGLVMNIFKEQGLSLTIPTGSTEPGMEQLSLEEITPEEAEELIAEDGYFGVEQTSERIVDFAIGIAGGDPARIEAIKAGVEKGFNEAKKAFGDWLPEISYATYDKVMEKLDAWVADTATVQA